MALYKQLVNSFCLHMSIKARLNGTQGLSNYATLIIRPNHAWSSPRHFCSSPFVFFRNGMLSKNTGTTLCDSPVLNKTSDGVSRYFSTSRSLLIKRQSSNQGSQDATAGARSGTRSTLYYIAALGVFALGLSYAAVPLYRIFCQAYSYGGTTQRGHDSEKVEAMNTVDNRIISVRFNADTAASMTWNFKPQQHEIKVKPGETALAFYTAKNPTDRPVIGVSTYNVIPFDAGQYFNKIQCFCFEEQMLNPHEEVHMPVFFYIDPEFADDPKMENVDMLTLSYTFFEVREGIQLPILNLARS